MRPSLCGTPAKNAVPFWAQVAGTEMLFQSLLAQSFSEGLSQSFGGS